jgi:hypothetical protein
VERLRLNLHLSSQDQELVFKGVLCIMYGIIIFASIANLFYGLASTWQFLLKDISPIYWSLTNATS